MDLHGIININFYHFFIEFHTVGWGLLIVPIIEQPLGGSSSPPSRPSRTMMQGLMAFNEPRLGHGTSEKRTLKAKQDNRTLQRYIHIESYWYIKHRLKHVISIHIIKYNII